MSVVPVERREIHELRAAGIGDIGDVKAALVSAGQVPDQPAVDVAEQRVAGLRPSRARRAHYPGARQLEAGEIAGERQAGLGAEAVLAAVAGEMRDEPIGARVLPDQRVVQRFAGGAVPQERWSRAGW